MKHVAPIAAALVLFTAASARAEEPAAPPAGAFDQPAPIVRRYPPSTVRWKLISGGAFVTLAAFGIGYGASVGWPEVPGSGSLKIPIAGPWIALARSGCAVDDTNCGLSIALRSVAYVLSGIVQLGGLGMIGEGIFMTTEAPPKRRMRAPAAAFTIVPTPVVGRSPGIGISGTF